MNSLYIVNNTNQKCEKYHFKHTFLNSVVMLFVERQMHHTNRTLPLMLTDNSSTLEAEKLFLMQANIVLESLSQYNEMGIYASMRTVQTDAKHVDRICNQSQTKGPEGHAVLIKSVEKQNSLEE